MRTFRFESLACGCLVVTEDGVARGVPCVRHTTRVAPPNDTAQPASLLPQRIAFDLEDLWEAFRAGAESGREYSPSDALIARSCDAYVKLQASRVATGELLRPHVPAVHVERAPIALPDESAR